MFLPARTALVIFLALLQLIAPLVHAHVSGASYAVGQNPGKLHVPGLEDFGDPSALTNATNIGDYCTAGLSAPDEGLVVGVNSGIKQKLLFLDELSPDAHYDLPRPNLVLNFPIIVKGNVAPRAPPLLSCVYVFSPQSPRAPPLL
jgi:hypothetical protein